MSILQMADTRADTSTGLIGVQSTLATLQQTLEQRLDSQLSSIQTLQTDLSSQQQSTTDLVATLATLQQQFDDVSTDIGRLKQDVQDMKQVNLRNYVLYTRHEAGKVEKQCAIYNA